MIRKTTIFSLTLLSILAFSACEPEVNEGYSDELLRLNAYMSLNYPDLTPTESGLYYKLISEGNGKSPQEGDFLLFDFTGQNLDDEVYETTNASIAELHDIFAKSTHYAPKYLKYKDDRTPLINGLEEGFSYISEGAVARFIMPSPLAYGTSKYGILNPYSSVIIDVEFLKIVSDPEAYEIEQVSAFIAENYPDLDIEETIASLTTEGVIILEEALVEVEVDEEDEETTDPHQTIEDDDVISVDYTGRFLDYWIFDTSIKEVASDNGTYQPTKTYEPIKVTIGGTGHIEGFSIALKKLKTNSTATILILSEYAYGEFGSSSNIPPYTPLIFELEVHTKTSSASDAESK